MNKKHKEYVNALFGLISVIVALFLVTQIVSVIEFCDDCSSFSEIDPDFEVRPDWWMGILAILSASGLSLIILWLLTRNVKDEKNE